MGLGTGCSLSWQHIQAPWPCSWGRMDLEQMVPAGPAASGSFCSSEWERRGSDCRLCKNLPQMWVHLFCLHGPAIRRRRYLHKFWC